MAGLVAQKVLLWIAKKPLTGLVVLFPRPALWSYSFCDQYCWAHCTLLADGSGYLSVVLSRCSPFGSKFDVLFICKFLEKEYVLVNGKYRTNLMTFKGFILIYFFYYTYYFMWYVRNMSRVSKVFSVTIAIMQLSHSSFLQYVDETGKEWGSVSWQTTQWVLPMWRLAWPYKSLGTIALLIIIMTPLSRWPLCTSDWRHKASGQRPKI